jgi:hypothetical protein
MNQHATIKEAVFSLRTAPRLYNEHAARIRNPYGGEVEYLHREPASRRRRRKGSLKSERVKYGSESQGTRTWERLRWLGPVVYIKDRPVRLSERASHKKQNRNCQTVINIWGSTPRLTGWLPVSSNMTLTWLELELREPPELTFGRIMARIEFGCTKKAS